MKKLLVLLLTLGIFSACSNTQTIETTNTNNTPISLKKNTNNIVIGGIAPFSGDASVYGEMVRDVTSLRLKQINQSGGINGKELVMKWEDGKCNPKDASMAAQKLINIDKINVILGGTCSGETMGAAPITEKNNVLLFSTVSSSPEVTNAGKFVFRVAPNDNSAAKVLAEYANTSNYKKIALVIEQTDYAVALGNAFSTLFKGDILKETYLPTEADFKTRITKLKNADIEAIVLIPQTPNKLDIWLKQMTEQNWDKPLLAGEMLASAPEIAKKHADFLQNLEHIGSNFSAPKNETFENFIAEFETTYKKPLTFQGYAATTYDGINILAETLTQVETNDTEAIKNILDSNSYNGIFGELNFDENGDINIYHSLFTFDGTEFVPVTE